MHPILWLAAASLASAAFIAPRVGSEVWLGMLAPLTVVVVTWMVTARTFRTQPERVTSVMVTAFGAKVLFFGLYVALAVVVFQARPVPFVVSFAMYFIVLHLFEALLLKRLFA